MLDLSPYYPHMNTKGAILVLLALSPEPLVFAKVVEGTGKPKSSTLEALQALEALGLVRKTELGYGLVRKTELNTSFTSSENRTKEGVLVRKTELKEASSENRTEQNPVLEGEFGKPNQNAQNLDMCVYISSSNSLNTQILEEKEKHIHVDSSENRTNPGAESTSLSESPQDNPPPPPLPPSEPEPPPQAEPTPPKTRRKPKAPPEIPSDDLRRLLEAYNQNRGKLPAAETLNPQRIKAFLGLIELVGGLEVAIGVVSDAARFVSDERYRVGQFWIKERYGLDNLMAGNKWTGYAEKWRAGNPSKTIAQRETEDDWLS